MSDQPIDPSGEAGDAVASADGSIGWSLIALLPGIGAPG